jgi:hypothetical protein
MPRVLLVHHPLSSLSQDALRHELSKHYSPDEVVITDAPTIEEGGANIDDMTELVKHVIAFADMHGARLWIICTQEEDSKNDFILAHIRPNRTLVFLLDPDDGGGIMSHFETKGVRVILPGGGIEFVISAIAQDDKEQPP